MIKSTLNTGLRCILSLSLIFIPSYGYSNSNVETLINRLEAEYRRTQEDLPLEFREASQVLREMGEAFTENRLGEYIDSRPALKTKFDLLSLSNQSVTALDYKESPTFTVHFDEESKSVHSYKRILTNIDVAFNDQGKLVFKGIVVSESQKHNLNKKIGLIHTFDNIEEKDIVDWDYDKEFLVLLHRKRGFILYHMMFVYELLGVSPIPSISLPAGHVLDLKNVKLEFIDRTVQPPVKGSHNDVAVNLDGKPMFSAGDLLISYDDSNNEKRITRVLARSKDLIPAVNKQYMILDSLIKVRNLKLDRDTSSSGSSLELYLTEILDTILSAVLNKKAISYFSKFSELIELMPYFLTYRYVDKNSDRFSHTEWLEDYQRITESAPHLFNNRLKEEGKIISSEEIVKALKPIVAIHQEEQRHRLKKWLNNKYIDLIKEHKIDIGVIIVAWILASAQTFSSLSYYRGVGNSTGDAVNNLLFLGVGFLVVVAAAGHFAIPILNKLKQNLPLPGEFELTLEQIIEKWGADHIRTRDRLAAFGFKVAALSLPLIYRGFQILGEPHVHAALTQGVNPFQRVNPQSDLGRAGDIRRPMFLGLGWPRWRRGEFYEKKSQLVDLASEQKKRVESLSRLMAYYALSNQEFDIRSLLTGPFSMDHSFDYKDQKLMLDFNYVSYELSEYILKHARTDLTRSIFEWDVTEINDDFNRKALEIAQKVQSIAWTRKQVRELRRVVTQGFQKGLAWNTEEARVLMSYYPTPAAADQFWRGLIIDHLALVGFPLTSLTPRGDFYIGNMHVAAIEPYTMHRSSAPHLYEAGANIGIHDVMSARQQLQFLVLKRNEKLKKLFEKQEKSYAPLEEYFNLTKNTPGVWQYTLDSSKYPGNFGEKIYEGKEQEERIDAGGLLWKSIRIGMRLWAVSLPIMILGREIFTPEYSFYSNVVGALYFAGAGFILFGLPQIWTMHHNLVFTKRSEETKKIIDGIKLTDHRIRQKLYDSFSSLDSDYEKALHGFKKLYHSAKPFRRKVSLETFNSGIKAFIQKANFEEVRLREFIQSQTIEEKAQQIYEMSSLLNTRYLPTEINKNAFDLSILLTLGIFSNVVFVFVSDKSFTNLTLFDSLFWLGLLVFSGYAYNRLSSKSISDHIKDIKRGAKRMGPNIRNKCSLVFRNLKLKK
ncbi:MAG: hypothetical protein OXM55_05960 [Bdellovibrionales bacterium]|nr:hypothetical protein [Bdellovibrionales bacterium]